jgi:nicotinate-nucleotide adenylyltransferase
MLELALGDNPAFEISRLELDRPGPHFTLETLQFLRAHEPAAEITLLLGGDSLHDLPGWRQPGEILAACNAIGVMRRAGESGDLLELERKLPGIRAKVRFLDAPLIGIASRDIRDRVSKGLPFRYLLPPAVYDYVLRRRLYHS